MALRSVKQTLLNLDDVFVNTEDGERYVTDRYIAWRLTDLEGRSKLAEVLRHVPDGCYRLSAAGAVSAHPSFRDTPKIARLMPDEFGDKLEELGITLDYGRTGARLYMTPAGVLVGIDARFESGGFTLRCGAGGPNKAVTIHKGEDVAGIVMPVRLDNRTADLRRVAETFAVTAAS